MDDIVSRHEDVVALAERIGRDIGSLPDLDTNTKESLVAAINELAARIYLLEVPPKP